MTGCSRAQKAEIFLADEQTEKDGASPEQEETDTGTGQEDSPPEKERTEAVNIFVDVCGAVMHPGVYGMPPDSRVFQAIEMAGGFLPEAAGTYINQAQPLSDGQQIYVPTKEEAEEMAAGGTAGKDTLASGIPGESREPEKINLNTADAAALQTLSGIGEAKAEAILAYREEHGGFSSIEEIMNVPGIKESTFSNIKDKIAVE